MSWKPVNEIHSIERVRLQLDLETPLHDKFLNTLAAPLVERLRDLQFDSVERSPSLVQSIGIPVLPAGQIFNVQPSVVPQVMNGWDLKRSQDGVVVEDAALRDLRIGYLSQIYARWDNYWGRFLEIYDPIIDQILQVNNIARTKLEYWDSFYFDGNVEDASIPSLLSQSGQVYPEHVRSGKSLWHMHLGWFAEPDVKRMLININLDANERQAVDGLNQRIVTIYNMIEYRSDGLELEKENLFDTINLMHRTLHKAFAEILSPEMRSKINIDPRNYEL